MLVVFIVWLVYFIVFVNFIVLGIVFVLNILYLLFGMFVILMRLCNFFNILGVCSERSLILFFIVIFKGWLINLFEILFDFLIFDFILLDGFVFIGLYNEEFIKILFCKFWLNMYLIVFVVCVNKIW